MNREIFYGLQFKSTDTRLIGLAAMITFSWPMKNLTDEKVTSNTVTEANSVTGHYVTLLTEENQSSIDLKSTTALSVS